ncbi:MAG: helix-turn-helix domain-containing protein [Acidobacteriota bacterium]
MAIVVDVGTRIRRGTRRPSLVTTFRPTDVQVIRSTLGVSQSEFALMIGVSVATLRNWEQGNELPTGRHSLYCALRRAIQRPWFKRCTRNPPRGGMTST